MRVFPLQDEPTEANVLILQHTAHSIDDRSALSSHIVQNITALTPTSEYTKTTLVLGTRGTLWTLLPFANLLPLPPNDEPVIIIPEKANVMSKSDMPKD